MMASSSEDDTRSYYTTATETTMTGRGARTFTTRSSSSYTQSRGTTTTGTTSSTTGSASSASSSSPSNNARPSSSSSASTPRWRTYGDVLSMMVETEKNSRRRRQKEEAAATPTPMTATACMNDSGTAPSMKWCNVIPSSSAASCSSIWWEGLPSRSTRFFESLFGSKKSEDVQGTSFDVMMCLKSTTGIMGKNLNQGHIEETITFGSGDAVDGEDAADNGKTVEPNVSSLTYTSSEATATTDDDTMKALADRLSSTTKKSPPMDTLTYVMGVFDHDGSNYYQRYYYNNQSNINHEVGNTSISNHNKNAVAIPKVSLQRTGSERRQEKNFKSDGSSARRDDIPSSSDFSFLPVPSRDEWNISRAGAGNSTSQDDDDQAYLMPSSSHYKLHQKRHALFKGGGVGRLKQNILSFSQKLGRKSS